MIKKLFRGLFWTALGGVVVIVVMVKGFGLRMELWGSGMRPHFYFFKPESHEEAIEHSRQAQNAQAMAVPASSAAPAATPSGMASSPAGAPGLAVPSAAATGVAAYWTSFRGPHRDGVYDETAVLTAWPAGGLRRLWKQPVGGGYASVVVADGRAYTIEQRRNKETAAAYDVATGRELWTNAWPALFQEAMGGDGPRATPTWDNGRLYVLGASGEFRCLNATTGANLWSRDILAENHASNIQWGMSASPLVVDDNVIVLPGGANGKSVVAYDKLTGKPAWSVLDDTAAYASPKLVTIGGERQIVVMTSARVAGLSPQDGKVRWEYPWVTEYGVNSAEPVLFDGNRFFLSSGYNHGGAAIEVTKSGDSFSAKELWSSKKMKNRFNASVYYQGYLYGLDEGILACLDASTGALKWKGGRYGYGQVLLASGHLIVLTEEGEVALVMASPEKLQEVARFTAIEGKTWNYPAIADGVLFVRNSVEMAAFKII